MVMKVICAGRAFAKDHVHGIDYHQQHGAGTPDYMYIYMYTCIYSGMSVIA
jgi:hypothetical protein